MFQIAMLIALVAGVLMCLEERTRILAQYDHKIQTQIRFGILAAPVLAAIVGYWSYEAAATWFVAAAEPWVHSNDHSTLSQVSAIVTLFPFFLAYSATNFFVTSNSKHEGKEDE